MEDVITSSPASSQVEHLVGRSDSLGQLPVHLQSGDEHQDQREIVHKKCALHGDLFSKMRGGAATGGTDGWRFWQHFCLYSRNLK